MMAKATFESALTLVLGGTQLEVECLKGYGTIKSLGTTGLVQLLWSSMLRIATIPYQP